MDGPIGAGGPDVVPNAGPPPTGERRKLKLAPRSKQPAGPSSTGGPGPAPASAKKASIFGGGKAHDEFAYEVRLFWLSILFVCWLFRLCMLENRLCALGWGGGCSWLAGCSCAVFLAFCIVIRRKLNYEDVRVNDISVSARKCFTGFPLKLGGVIV